MNEFARQIGISSAYWSRIERSMEKPPKDELIQKAAEILGLDSDEAFIKANRFPPICSATLATSSKCIAAKNRVKGNDGVVLWRFFFVSKLTTRAMTYFV